MANYNVAAAAADIVPDFDIPLRFADRLQVAGDVRILRLIQFVTMEH